MEHSVYTPGDGNPPPMLAGRDVLLRRILLGLNDVATVGRTRAEDIMLIGPDGVGKTATLEAYKTMAASGGFEVVDLSAVAGRVGLVESLLQRVTVGIAKAAGEVDADTLAEALVELAGQVQRDNPQGGLLAVVDDLNFASAADLVLLAATLRCLTDEHPQASVVFAVAGSPRTPALLQAAGVTDPDGLFAVEKLPVSLPAADATYAVVEPARRVGVSWHPDATAAVLAASNRYPALLQLYAHTAWTQARGPHVIESADAAAALPIAEAEMRRRILAPQWDRMLDPQKEYLAALAINDGRAPNMTVAITLGHRRVPETLSRLRDDLIDAGVVYSPAGGQTAFCVPSFAQFILDHYEAARELADTKLLSLTEMTGNKSLSAVTYQAQPTTSRPPQPATGPAPITATGESRTDEVDPQLATPEPRRQRWSRRRGSNHRD